MSALGVHFDVGSGEACIFGFIDLQELIAKFDAVVKAEERRHLLAKARIILHSVGIEDREDAVEVVGFKATLKIGQNVTDNFVGEVERLCRGQFRRGSLGKRGLGG